MFTKLVVTVASATRRAAHHPTPAAASIVPGSSLDATRASVQPTGINHSAGSARPANTADALAACRSGVARVVGEHQQPRDLVADHDVESPRAATAAPRAARRWPPRARWLMAAQVKTAPAIAINGTATRSARPTARGPRATIARGEDAEAGRPDSSGRRSAEDLGAHRRRNRVVDGDPREVGDVEQRRHQRGAAIAERRTRRDHRRHARSRTDRRQQRHEHRSDARRRRPPARARPELPYRLPSTAPVCSVVATTLAAAKIRKRSNADCVRDDSGMGERSAGFTGEVWMQGRRQKAEGRRHNAEGRRRKAEGRRQKAQGRRQKAQGPLYCAA